MEHESLTTWLPQLLRENLLAISLGCIGLLFLGYGLMSSSSSSTASEDIIIDTQAEEGNTESMIMVDVSGAVEKPGVYELSFDSRMSDAISKAGGMREDADHEYIAKTLNLAQKLTDGMKVYIPPVSDGVTQSVLAEQTGKISINNATSKELEELPGIGPVTAEKIISNRPYASLDELLSKKSVFPSVFENIKDQISL